MPEARSKSFAQELMKGGLGKTAHDEDEGRGAERQISAFSLNFRFKDGRRRSGISWGQYVTHEWEDSGENEILRLIMGMQVVTIEGWNLSVILSDIESGQRTRTGDASSCRT